MASSPVERVGKRRAPMSCDRCKSRKTKCVDPVPGPCQFCASIGATCQVDPSRRRQRPYYHVSEEEFRYMTRALEHFLPNTEINLASLRELMSSLDAPSRQQSAVAIPQLQGQLGQLGQSLSHHTNQALTDVSSETSRSSRPPGDGRQRHAGSATPNETPEDSVTIEEIDDLHGELGWLTVDSKGNYRHVGMEGGFGFNAAVRSLKHRRKSDSTKSVSVSDLVTPLTAAPPCPPETPESSMGMIPPRQVFLPRRDLCERCVGRFFRDVHSIYWLFSAETFYATLDRIYAGDSTRASASMLCSLYAMLALTCESEARSDGATVADATASKYLSLAKALAPVLFDEADIDAIRALCLLGIALQSSMFANTAYIYIGSATRIAFTLGLNLAKSLSLRGSFQGQTDLRIFCTLYLLDLDVALCYGNPPALSDEDGIETLQLLSEQILSPGTNMPLDFLSVSCKLAQLKRRINKLLYLRSGGGNPAPSTGGQRPAVSVSSISAALASLREWYDSIPPHLRDVAQAAPYHKRSVAVLHLRYWSAVIFATRPFLLYNVLHPQPLGQDHGQQNQQQQQQDHQQHHQNDPIMAAAALTATTTGAGEGPSGTGSGTSTGTGTGAAAAASESKRRYFDEFSAVCLDAAAQSLALLSYMREAGVLSSLVTFDTGCVLEDLQVFLLALAKSGSGSKLVVPPSPPPSGTVNMMMTDHGQAPNPHQQQLLGPQQATAADSVRECLHVLQGMEQVFWTRHALTEVMAQLDEHGLLNGDSGFSPGGETPGLFCLDITPHHDIVSEMMESYLHDAQDMFFAIPDTGSM